MNCLLLPKNSPLTLAPDNPKLEHVKSVLKLKDGDEIFAGTLGAPLQICSIRYISDGSAYLVPLRPAPQAPTIPVTLAVSYARPQIARRILFESACFGIENLIFYSATKGEADYAKSSLYTSGEWMKRMVEGAEQACASSIPSFQTASSLEDAIERAVEISPADSLRAAPDLYEATSNYADFLKAGAERPHCILAFGSERGFANSDRLLLREKSFELVSLGERVLRTDTAIMAAMAIFSALNPCKRPKQRF